MRTDHKNDTITDLFWGLAVAGMIMTALVVVAPQVDQILDVMEEKSRPHVVAER